MRTLGFLVFVLFHLSFQGCEPIQCYDFDQKALDKCGYDPRPITVYVQDGGPSGAKDYMLAQAGVINDALDCAAVTVVDSPNDDSLRFEWKDYTPDLCGDAVACEPSRWEPLVVVAWDNLPPEESTTGQLDYCNAGYLFDFYVGLKFGLRPTYNPKDAGTTIRYAHPDCNGGPVFNWAASMKAELDAAGLDVCNKKVRF